MGLQQVKRNNLQALADGTFNIPDNLSQTIQAQEKHNAALLHTSKLTEQAILLPNEISV